MAKADAQIVAWEADDSSLKSIFRQGKNLPRESAIVIFGDDSPQHYKLAKSGIHACNYGVSARTLAITLGIPIREAQAFIDRWFLEHPGIRLWHENVLRSITIKGKCFNIYGQSFTFFGRNRSKLSDALGWIGQSSVALNCTNAMLALDHLETHGVQILLQVHDSIVFQVHKDTYPSIMPSVHQALHQTCPYKDPLIIPWTLKGSARSWGDSHDMDWNNLPVLDTL